MGDFTKASAAAKDVLEMIAREPSIDSTSPSGEQPDVVDGRIELRNINFRYPARPTVQVLSDISITFEAGKSTALVGASGSGKSTIIALAERWYDPESGSVELDGRDLKSLNLKWLRRQMGLVQQEPVLFNDTVMMNVLYGHHDPDSLTEEEKKRIVKQACIEANADEFIEALPEGYDTVVGERASLMSGGQKQRIAIARSIVSNPRILLLDEATSALDPKAEGIVQAALDKAAKTRTTIIVAHRLATVKKADKIVVLNKGMVVEQGTYEGLLEAEGAFYRLVNAQKLSVMDEDVEDGDAVETEEAEDLGNIERVETRHSNWTDRPASELQQEDISRRLSFFRCLCIIFYEHRHLWLWFFAGVAGCILGGAVCKFPPKTKETDSNYLITSSRPSCTFLKNRHRLPIHRRQTPRTRRLLGSNVRYARPSHPHSIRLHRLHLDLRRLHHVPSPPRLLFLRHDHSRHLLLRPARQQLRLPCRSFIFRPPSTPRPNPRQPRSYPRGYRQPNLLHNPLPHNRLETSSSSNLRRFTDPLYSRVYSYASRTLSPRKSLRILPRIHPVCN